MNQSNQSMDVIKGIFQIPEYSLNCRHYNKHLFLFFFSVFDFQELEQGEAGLEDLDMDGEEGLKDLEDLIG